MALASFSLRHAFGLKGDVANNVTYIDEQTVALPVGRNTILYNIDQRTQRFIPGLDKSMGMTALAVSPNRRYIAVAEKAEKATVAIYDLHALRFVSGALTSRLTSLLPFLCLSFDIGFILKPL